MTYTLRFLPEVEEDAINGYVWYETKSRGLGEDFLRMFYACANEIPLNPLLYKKVYQDFRRRWVCDKNIGKVDNSFYLPYNLVNYKQPEGGGYGRINRVFAAEKEISVP